MPARLTIDLTTNQEPRQGLKRDGRANPDMQTEQKILSREPPASLIARRELEESWRSEVENARARYYAAKEEYLMTLERNLVRLPVDLNSACLQARQVETKALAEYARVLRIFTSVMFYGRMPEQ